MIHTFTVTGKISTFGGPKDMGVTRTEGLALIEPPDLKNPWFSELFLPETTAPGLARRLNPDKFYCAARWNYLFTSRSLLRKSLCRIETKPCACFPNGRGTFCRPVDWGPNLRTGRAMDLSPGLAKYLGLKTDDTATLTLVDAETGMPVRLRYS